VITVRSERSRPAAGTGAPTGQKVSKPFARVHWGSDRWRSRAVTSLSGRTAETAAPASSALDQRREIAAHLTPLPDILIRQIDRHAEQQGCMSGVTDVGNGHRGAAHTKLEIVGVEIRH